MGEADCHNATVASAGQEPSPQITVTMLLHGHGRNDSRVIRAATAMSDAGYRVIVVCRFAVGVPRVERYQGVEFRRCKLPVIDHLKAWLGTGRLVPETNDGAAAGSRDTRGGGSATPGPARRRLSARLARAMTTVNDVTGPWRMFALVTCGLFATAARTRPAIVHAHDLYTLPLGMLLARWCGARLVYDSHEMAVRQVLREPRTATWVKHVTEGRCIRRADLVITVSDGFARALRFLYKLPAKPLVIYNAPPRSRASPGARDLRADIGLQRETPLIVHIGSISRKRGQVEVVDALAHLPRYHLALVGAIPASRIAEMQTQAAELGCDARLHVLPPVASDDVAAYCATADVAVVPRLPLSFQQRYSLPNKFFESVQAGLPIVAGDTPELRRLVERFELGLAVDCRSPAGLARALARVYESRQMYRERVLRLIQTGGRYTWESESHRLLDAYNRMIGAPSEIA